MTGPEPLGAGDPPDAAAGQTPARFGLCGSTLHMQQDPGLPLQLSAALTATPLAATANRPYALIDLAVKNLSASAVLVTTSRSGARMAITKDGTVVASPGGNRLVATQYTINADAIHRYMSTVNLVDCNTNSALTPGHYQLHALQTFTFLDKDWSKERAIVVYGGPWDIEIR